jgi:hypothetical protein
MWCVLAKYTCPKCKNKYEANDARLLWVLEADVSNSYPVLPNYANGTFHFHKDLTNLMDGFMRTYGNGSWFGKRLHRKMGVQYTRTCETYFCRKCGHQFLSKMEFTGKIWPPFSTDIRKYFSSAKSSPLNRPFYKRIYGANLVRWLGLFHLMHRIVDTLDAHSMVYRKVLVKLKAFFYTHREVNLSALIRCGRKLLRTQIDEIQHSKKWKSRCDAFLQRSLKLGPSVNFSLFKWIDDCKNLADNAERQAFTNTTIKAAKNQLEKVEHAEDPNSIDMYIEIPAGKASSHGLSKWQSKHPELALEKGHESLIHYANGRCTPELGDILTLGGMAAHNVRRHWICKLNELKLKGTEVS